MMNIPADKTAKRTSTANELVRAGVVVFNAPRAAAQMPPPGDRIAVRS